MVANGSDCESPDDADSITLEKVIGLTATSSAALDCNWLDGTVAYPAGCTVVLLDEDGAAQLHLVSSSRKPVVCLAFAPNGQYLVTAESGQQPNLRIWNLPAGTVVAELGGGHAFGISCLRFCPKSRFLVSVGNQHDLLINVWDWQSGFVVASSKISCMVMALEFCESGAYFVTVGVRHVKFWYYKAQSCEDDVDVRSPLQGRSAILADQRNNVFRDVCCGTGELRGNTYAITQSGLLCLFSLRKQLEKWVDLKTETASSVCLGNMQIFVGCADGIVRVFNACSLDYTSTLPRPHYLGVDLACGLSETTAANVSYPDVVAVVFDPSRCRLTCVYDDHSLYVWDVPTDGRRPEEKVVSMLAHSGSIWGLDISGRQFGGTAVNLPADTFVTCSTDDTIRLWNLDIPPRGLSPYKPNEYSKELVQIICCDPELTCLKDPEMGGAWARDKDGEGYQLDGKSGVRTVCIGQQCGHLASGHRNGNVRIYALDSLELLRELQAHDGDVLCLQYCTYGQNLLATGSRDRLLHLLDVDNDYEPICTLDDHGSSVTAVRFAGCQGELVLVSCAADRTVICRRLDWDRQIHKLYSITVPAAIYDLVVGTQSQSVYVACQDRQVRVYGLGDGQWKHSVQDALSDDGTVIKVELDPSGTFMAACCRDKQVVVVDLLSSAKCTATLNGHSELVTGVQFTSDCQRLITVSGDGCIFVWRLRQGLVEEMVQRMNQVNGQRNDDDDSVDQSNQLSPSAAAAAYEDDSRRTSIQNESSGQNEEVMSNWAHNNTAGRLQANGRADPHQGAQMEVASSRNGHSTDAVQRPSDEQSFRVNDRLDAVKRQMQWAQHDNGSTQYYSAVSPEREKVESSQPAMSPLKDRFPYARSDSTGLIRQRFTALYEFPDTGTNEEQIEGGAFRRSAPGRQSLTQRFLNRFSPERKPSRMSTAATNVISDTQSKLSTSPSLTSSLSGLSSMDRPESDRMVGASQLQRTDLPLDIGLPKMTSSPVSPSASSSLSCQRLERIRKPLNVPSPSPVQSDAAKQQLYGSRRHTTLPTYLSSPPADVDNYEHSELHAHTLYPAFDPDSTISELCKTLLLKEVLTTAKRPAAAPLANRNSGTSLRSSCSMISLAAAAAASSDRYQTATMRRLSDIRQKLRKSHENLWNSNTGAGAESAKTDGTSSSVAQRMKLGGSVASLLVGPEMTPLGQRRGMARSMGYLPVVEDSPWTSMVLSKTVRDLAKLSRSDLHSAAARVVASEGDGPIAYSRSTTLPRISRFNGPVQRRANHLRFGIRTVDSEESSDATTPASSVHRYASPRRRHGSNVSVSDRYYDRCSSPLLPRPADRQRLSEMVTSQRLIEALPNKRSPSYLHRLLGTSGGRYADQDLLQRDGRIDCYRVDLEGPHFSKMDDHCKESADGFMKALDKVLHAFNMVVADCELGEDEKQRLVALLKPRLESAQKRLQIALGGHDVDDGSLEPPTADEDENAVHYRRF